MKITLRLYLGLTLLMLADLILFLSKGISLRGHTPDWLLFWSWTVFTLAALIRYRKIKWVKIYSISLMVFLILTMIPMMLPFARILGFAIEGYDKRYRVSETIEIMEFSKGPISIPTVVAIKSFGFYERIVGEIPFEFEVGDDYFRIEDAKGIRQLPNEQNDSLKIEFKFETGTVVRSIL